MVIIGTPALIASATEFHPQCVTNPPTAPWFKINGCGAHPFISIPLFFSLILSLNPSGNHVSSSSLPLSLFFR
uniref:Uncharacterized protein n=1 Tax=Cajanus cajan TaxID=3821 RepID=A0A151UCY9_CAJCA|nr:hypothetical protein KK1_021434 [Cajanus cajan]